MSSARSNRPRVALVGISGYAKRHLGLLREFERGLDLRAAVIIERDQGLEDAQELRQGGVAIYSSFDAMIAAEAGTIDLCVIPTGIQWHARMAVGALEAGMNVLVEKPLTGCEADALAIRACEERTGRWVAVGFQDIYSTGARQCKELLCAGRIGRLKSIRMIGLSWRTDDYYTRNHWVGRLEANGAATNDSPLNNAFAHLANLALFFGGASLGESSEVAVTHAELFRAREIESFDTAVVIGRSGTDIDFWFGTSHVCAGSPTPVIRIEGEHGAVEWHRSWCFRILSEGGAEEEVALVSDDEVCRSMYAAILERLAGGSPFMCDTGIALQHTRLIDSIHRRFPIERIDSSLIERVPTNNKLGSTVIAIRDVRSSMEAAFARGCSLAELGFPPRAAFHQPCGVAHKAR